MGLFRVRKHSYKKHQKVDDQFTRIYLHASSGRARRSQFYEKRVDLGCVEDWRWSGVGCGEDVWVGGEGVLPGQSEMTKLSLSISARVRPKKRQNRNVSVTYR